MTRQLKGIKATRGYGHAALEQQAMGVRSVLMAGRGLTDPVEGVTLFESLDQYTVKAGSRSIPLVPQVQPFPRGVEALTRYSSRHRHIRVTFAEYAYHALSNEIPHFRFTLAHEVGHAVLHTEDLVKMTSLPHLDQALARQSQSHKIYEDTEWQADAFAGALLMPAQGLLALERESGTLTEALVAERYGVSVAAARVRLSIFNARRSELLRSSR